ncbi:cobalamin biosynthesis protein [Litoribacillus peritrichatus]|uniref:Cobalamin biosynthesis protein CbiG n=1 Tax=Litoribacillus peritrichatus TaxID=718191 RepID=A0ABP7MBC7_9GAMM
MTDLNPLNLSGHATVVSLTDSGNALAEKIMAQQLAARHLHKPKPFAETIHELFNAGTPLILICAMGIAVRTLASVIKDKFSDPAVLVLDELGRYVIPVLSGHEGGANEWSRLVAAKLNAQHIITSAQNYLEPKYIVGMGCERHCPELVLRTLLEETLSKKNIKLDQISAIASIDVKADEVGLIELAATLGVPFKTYPALRLRDVEDQLSYKSEIVFKEVGCYGVAEAAALVAAEELITKEQIKNEITEAERSHKPAPKPELIIPKHKNKQATCAVARCYKS